MKYSERVILLNYKPSTVMPLLGLYSYDKFYSKLIVIDESAKITWMEARGHSPGMVLQYDNFG